MLRLRSAKSRSRVPFRLGCTDVPIEGAADKMVSAKAITLFWGSVPFVLLEYNNQHQKNSPGASSGLLQNHGGLFGIARPHNNLFSANVSYLLISLCGK